MKKRNRVIGILLLITVLMICAIWASLSGMQQDNSDENKLTGVHRYELRDFLKIAELDTEETDRLVLPTVSETLTYADEQKIWKILGFDQIFTEKQKNQSKELDRKQWCSDYEKLIQELGRNDIQKTTIQYLGNVPGEERIITDQGNFSSGLPKEFWVYGAEYTVYVSGSELYGVYSETKEAISQKTQKSDVKNDTDLGENSEGTDQIKQIRVLLDNDNQRQPLRSSFQIRCESSCTVSTKEQSRYFDSKAVYTEKNLKQYLDAGGKVILTPKKNHTLYIRNADNGKWSAGYRGTMEVYKNKKGYWIVNVLPVEEYLYGVVPGEMPESFATEALKAQAVCARTYAYRALEGNKYKEWKADVDDSVNCQVYNRNGENKKTTQAVNDTKGIILKDNGKAAAVYYFSSSCGHTCGLEAWGSDQTKSWLTGVSTLTDKKGFGKWDTFLKENNRKAYDSHSRYFRWKAVVRLPEGYELKIQKREKSGVVTDIVYVKGGKKRHIKTENTIRSELGKYLISVTDSHGNSSKEEMLPSAFFTVEKGSKNGEFILYGGGYGHGIGMSQYGADGMAKSGNTYKEILEFYFRGIVIS